MEMCVDLHFPPTLPSDKTPTPNEEAGWVPELVWMFGRREKCLAPARIQTLDHPPIAQSLYYPGS
jgi:hypothetical protein